MPVGEIDAKKQKERNGHTGTVSLLKVSFLRVRFLRLSVPRVILGSMTFLCQRIVLSRCRPSLSFDQSLVTFIGRERPTSDK